MIVYVFIKSCLKEALSRTVSKDVLASSKVLFISVAKIQKIIGICKFICRF